MRKRARIRSLLSFALVVIFSCSLLWLIFGDHGLLQAYRLRTELMRMDMENEGLRKENEALRIEVEALKSDMRYIERLAREKLGMARKDELVFMFERNGKHLTSTTVLPMGRVGKPGSAP